MRLRMRLFGVPILAKKVLYSELSVYRKVELWIFFLAIVIHIK